jgi:5-aminopentanamidase
MEQALSLIVHHASLAGGQGARLVCFPECFLQGYDVRPAHVSDVAVDFESSEFQSVLRGLQSVEPVTVLGVIEKENGKFFNTAAVIAGGALVARYRKRHLTANEREIFEPGGETVVFAVDGVSVGINICMDLRFRESAQSALDAGAELLVCPCNNLLTRSTAEDWKHRHHRIRRERAREASVFIVSSDVTGEHDGRVSYGPTAVIDPDGELVAQVPLMTTGMVVADLDLRQRRQRM